MANVIDMLPPGTDSVLFLLLKLMYLLAIGLYVAFSLLVVRQINLMTGTLVNALSEQIKFIGWLHLFLALAILVLAIFVL